MARPPLLGAWLLVAAACAQKPPPDRGAEGTVLPAGAADATREVTGDPAVSEDPPPPARDPAPQSQPVAAPVVLEAVPTFVTTSGPPGHVRFRARTDAPGRILRIDSIEWIDGSRSSRLALGQVLLDNTPSSPVFEVREGEALVVVTFDPGDLPAAASSYVFRLDLRVDGRAERLDLEVRRATRHPVR